MSSWQLKNELRSRLGIRYSELEDMRATQRVYRLFYRQEMYAPENVDEYLYLGLYYRYSDNDLFLLHTKQARKMGSEKAHLRLFDYYWSTGNVKKATRYLNLGLKKKMSSVAFYCSDKIKIVSTLSLPLASLPPEEQKEQYRQMALKWKDFRLMVEQGHLAEAGKDYPEMVAWYEQCLETEKHEHESHYIINHKLGNYYHDVLGNKEKAKYYWTKNLACPPHDLPAKGNLAVFGLVSPQTKVEYCLEILQRNHSSLMIQAENILVTEYCSKNQHGPFYYLVTQTLGYRSDQPRINQSNSSPLIHNLVVRCKDYLSRYESFRLCLLYDLPNLAKDYAAPLYYTDPNFLHFTLRLRSVPDYLQAIHHKYLNDLFVLFRDKPTYLSRYYLPLDIFILIKNKFTPI